MNRHNIVDQDYQIYVKLFVKMVINIFDTHTMIQ